MAVKAAITPPEFIPTWATDGGAENVNPGPAKRAAGFITDEAPAAGTMNNQLGAYGGWQEYMIAGLKYIMAATNNDYTETEPWAEGATAPEYTAVIYDDLANRWYARTIQTGNDVAYQDSTNGETWSARVEMGTTIGNPFLASNVVTDGSVCGLAVKEFFYKSTDLSVANLPAPGAPTGTINATAGYDVFSVIWDPINSLWIAVGSTATTNGFIDTSPDGITWTTRLNIADSILDIATDGNGRSVVTTNSNVAGNGRFYYSDNGTTWTLSATELTGISGSEIYYCAGLGTNGAYLATDGNINQELWISLDGDSWTKTAWEFDWLWYNQDFFLLANTLTTPATMLAIVDISGSGTTLSAQTVNVGTRDNVVGPLTRTSEKDASKISQFRGNVNKIVWSYGGDHKMAIARFGPDAA